MLSVFGWGLLQISRSNCYKTKSPPERSDQTLLAAGSSSTTKQSMGAPRSTDGTPGGAPLQLWRSPAEHHCNSGNPHDTSLQLHRNFNDPPRFIATLATPGDASSQHRQATVCSTATRLKHWEKPVASPPAPTSTATTGGGLQHHRLL